MKRLLIPLAKSVLIPFALSATKSATDAAIQKKIYGSGTTALTILNEDMKDIMKIVKSLEESRLPIKRNQLKIKRQLKIKQKNKKEIFSNIIGNIRC